MTKRLNDTEVLQNTPAPSAGKALGKNEDNGFAIFFPSMMEVEVPPTNEAAPDQGSSLKAATKYLNRK